MSVDDVDAGDSVSIPKTGETETINLVFREVSNADVVDIRIPSADFDKEEERLTSYLPELNEINTARAAELAEFARAARNDPETKQFEVDQGYRFLEGDELVAKLGEAQELVTQMVGFAENQPKFVCQELKVGTAVALGENRGLNVIIGVVAKGNNFYLLFHPVPDLGLEGDKIEFDHMGETNSGIYKPYMAKVMIDELHPSFLFSAPFAHSHSVNYPLEEAKAA